MTSNDVLHLSSTNTSYTEDVIGSKRGINVEHQFNLAQVDKPKSFYLVYKGDYESILEDPSGYAFIPEDFTSGSSAKIKTLFFINSAHGYILADPGLVLFSYHYYRGTAKQYTKDDPDITGTFPPGNTEGVSSYIVTGGTWELWTGTNFSGSKIEVKKGEKSPNFGADDQIQSVRFIHN